MEIRINTQLLKQLPDLARASGIAEDRERAGLMRLHERCLAAGTATVRPLEIASAWSLGPDEAARFMEVHLSAGVFVSGPDGFVVPSCAWYEKLKAGLRAGGKKAQQNLKQYSGSTPPRDGSSPASTSSSKSGPAAPSTPAPAARALSAQEQCWDWLDHLAVEHCSRLGLPRASQQRPKLCNPKLNDACKAAGVVDFILESHAYTRWDHLGTLFKLYLQEELGRVDERTGRLREPPWPIEVFLSEGVLRRLKEQEERAA